VTTDPLEAQSEEDRSSRSVKGAGKESSMTREEILATTYPLPTREGDQNYLQADAHYKSLRAVVDYESPPPAFIFEGPGRTALSLRRRLIQVTEMRRGLQEAFERGVVPRLEFDIKQQRNDQYLEAYEKAIPMAEAGWEIYTYGHFLAVLVLPE
jgi:hypothetical protein